MEILSELEGRYLDITLCNKKESCITFISGTLKKEKDGYSLTEISPLFKREHKRHNVEKYISSSEYHHVNVSISSPPDIETELLIRVANIIINDFKETNHIF